MRGSPLCLIGAALILSVASFAIAAQSLTVQIRNATLHEEPAFLAAIVANAPYGSPVTLVEERGDWTLVEYNGQRGWLHASAVTDRSLSLRSGAAAEGVSSDELALAGKGFNPAVESSFRQTYGGYQWVDRAETLRYPPEELAVFIEQGGLNTGRCAP
ncbi:MAG: SH3 domain-containing protein [Oceanidesulfovibrio sp.]